MYNKLVVTGIHITIVNNKKQIKMKKIKSNLDKLKAQSVSRDQLKQIMGGYEVDNKPNSTCTAQCSGFSVTCYSYSTTSGCSAGDGIGCAGWDIYGVQYVLSC